MTTPTMLNQSMQAGLAALPLFNLLLNDDIFLTSATTQATASSSLRSGANRVTASGGAAAACVLPALINYDQGSDFVFVINDSANSIAVFAAPGDTMQGTLNGSLTVAAGGTGFFVRVPPLYLNPPAGFGITATQWRAAAMT